LRNLRPKADATDEAVPQAIRRYCRSGVQGRFAFRQTGDQFCLCSSADPFDAKQDD